MPFHHTYTTEGIVIASSPQDEASKFLYILTPDLGLVGVKAQGVRELKSKLRFHLQDFTHLELSLVRGKSGWRVTNAASLRPSIVNDTVAPTLKRVCSLIKLLCAGEDANETLFRAL